MKPMDEKEILELQAAVRLFTLSGERTFAFEVASPPDRRIDFIYRAIFPGFSRVRFYSRFFWGRVAQYLDYSPLKVFIYRRIGIRIGKGVFISPDVILDVHFPSLIEIGDNAILGWGVKLFTHEYQKGYYRMGRIKIGPGAVIGAYAIIRGGVEVGDDAEVPALGVVIKDVPPGASPLAREVVKGSAGNG